MTATRHSRYQWETGGTYQSPYAYASGYTPLPDRKSFVPPSLKEDNDRFIRLAGSKPGIHVSDEGSKWPDFLANGCGYVAFFTSERVLSDLQGAGFEILDAT